MADPLDRPRTRLEPLGMAALIGSLFDVTLRAAHGKYFDGHPFNVIVSAVPRVDLVSAHLAFETSKALNRWPILLGLVSSATAMQQNTTVILVLVICEFPDNWS